MSQSYALYRDVVYVEATENTNQLGLTLVCVHGLSSEGKDHILAFALMAKETKENYAWMFEQLVVMGGGPGSEPHVIMTDFQSAIIEAVETQFSDSVHLLCQWNML